MTITEFLLARIAEDEEAVRDATPPFADRTFYSHFGSGADDWGVYYFNVPPSRVLAECEAKRRIVEVYQQGDVRPVLVLRAIASVYADHPDYNPEWAL